MKFVLRVEFTDGTSQEVTALASDMVAFESKFDLSIAKLEHELKLTHLLFLAWHSLKRQKQVTAEFDAWIDTVAMVGASETDPK